MYRGRNIPRTESHFRKKCPAAHVRHPPTDLSRKSPSPGFRYYHLVEHPRPSSSVRCLMLSPQLAGLTRMRTTAARCSARMASRSPHGAAGAGGSYPRWPHPAARTLPGARWPRFHTERPWPRRHHTNRRLNRPAGDHPVTDPAASRGPPVSGKRVSLLTGEVAMTGGTPPTAAPRRRRAALGSPNFVALWASTTAR